MGILLDNDPGAASTYSFAVGEDLVQVSTPHQLVRAVEEHPNDNLVIIGPTVELSVATEFASQQRMVRPHVGVVLIRRRLDVGVLAEALRSGIREAVTADDLESLGAACSRSREISTRQQVVSSGVSSTENGKVLVVFAAKGGCGKTTVSTNLAAALAADRNTRVCLIDLDLEFGDVAITLQLEPRRTISDALALKGAVDREALQSLVVRHESGVDVVLAPTDPSYKDRIPATLVGEVIQAARSMFDFVIIDTPPAFSEQVLVAMDLADTHILLTSLDIPAIKNLRVTLDTLDALGYPRETWQVLLNRSDSDVGLTHQDVEHALNAQITLGIPSSSAVSKSVNKGRPLVLEQPDHPVSRAFHELATLQRPVSTHVVGERRRSFFRRVRAS
jgi:pilus assembly protein CpaE